MMAYNRNFSDPNSYPNTSRNSIELPSPILSLRISQVNQHIITVCDIYAVCNRSGCTVLKIFICEPVSRSNITVLVEFNTIWEAERIQEFVHERYMFENSCFIEAYFTKLQSLEVTQNTDRTWDLKIAKSPMVEITCTKNSPSCSYQSYKHTKVVKGGNIVQQNSEKVKGSNILAHNSEMSTYPNEEQERDKMLYSALLYSALADNTDYVEKGNCEQSSPSDMEIEDVCEQQAESVCNYTPPYSSSRTNKKFESDKKDNYKTSIDKQKHDKELCNVLIDDVLLSASASYMNEKCNSLSNSNTFLPTKTDDVSHNSKSVKMPTDTVSANPTPSKTLKSLNKKSKTKNNKRKNDNKESHDASLRSKGKIRKRNYKQSSCRSDSKQNKTVDQSTPVKIPVPAISKSSSRPPVLDQWIREDTMTDTGRHRDDTKIDTGRPKDTQRLPGKPMDTNKTEKGSSYSDEMVPYPTNLKLITIPLDGNSLFSSVAYHIFGSVILHRVARLAAVDHMKQHFVYFCDKFSEVRRKSKPRLDQYINKYFPNFVENMSELETEGEEICLLALAEVYKLKIDVYSVCGNSKCISYTSERLGISVKKTVALYFDKTHYVPLVLSEQRSEIEEIDIRAPTPPHISDIHNLNDKESNKLKTLESKSEHNEKTDINSNNHDESNSCTGSGNILNCTPSYSKFVSSNKKWFTNSYKVQKNDFHILSLNVREFLRQSKQDKVRTWLSSRKVEVAALQEISPDVPNILNWSDYRMISHDYGSSACVKDSRCGFMVRQALISKIVKLEDISANIQVLYIRPSENLFMGIINAKGPLAAATTLKKDEFYTTLSTVIAQANLHEDKPELIVVGDFNAYVGYGDVRDSEHFPQAAMFQKVSDDNGKRLINVIEETDLILLPGLPVDYTLRTSIVIPPISERWTLCCAKSDRRYQVDYVFAKPCDSISYSLLMFMPMKSVSNHKFLLLNIKVNNKLNVTSEKEAITPTKQETKTRTKQETITRTKQELLKSTKQESPKSTKQDSTEIVHNPSAIIAKYRSLKRKSKTDCESTNKLESTDNILPQSSTSQSGNIKNVHVDSDNNQPYYKEWDNESVSVQYGLTLSDNQSVFQQYGLVPSKIENEPVQYGLVPSNIENEAVQYGLQSSDNQSGFVQYNLQSSYSQSVSQQYGLVPSNIENEPVQYGLIPWNNESVTGVQFDEQPYHDENGQLQSIADTPILSKTINNEDELSYVAFSYDSDNNRDLQSDETLLSETEINLVSTVSEHYKGKQKKKQENVNHNGPKFVTFEFKNS